MRLVAIDVYRCDEWLMCDLVVMMPGECLGSPGISALIIKFSGHLSILCAGSHNIIARYFSGNFINKLVQC